MDPTNELSRWQGKVESDLQNLKERTTDLEGAVQTMSATLVRIQVQLQALKTQVGMWSALGGIIGAGIASAVALLVGSHG